MNTQKSYCVPPVEVKSRLPRFADLRSSLTGGLHQRAAIKRAHIDQINKCQARDIAENPGSPGGILDPDPDKEVVAP